MRGARDNEASLTLKNAVILGHLKTYNLGFEVNLTAAGQSNII